MLDAGDMPLPPASGLVDVLLFLAPLDQGAVQVSASSFCHDGPLVFHLV